MRLNFNPEPNSSGKENWVAGLSLGFRWEQGVAFGKKCNAFNLSRYLSKRHVSSNLRPLTKQVDLSEL